ncbi:chromosome transmission fidelity protein, partial [Trifolium medium]|nr:chromosome transmission fidelity protein [Trifolium medium]
RVEDPPVEEDWLRYSPPPTTISVEEVRFYKEKTLSRFASEIDGEVMPITAPNGDRVYTKLDRFYGEEQVTKLNCRGYSSG